MELAHHFAVPADLQRTWAAFNDIGSIATCFPGATLTSLEGDTFQGTVKIKLGPIAMQYAGTATFLERDQGRGRLVIKAHGKDRRGQGTADATVTARLAEIASGTRVEVLTQLTITGKPAQFGRGLIQDVSERLLAQFVDNVSRELADPGRTHEQPPSDPGSDDGAAPMGLLAANDRTPSARQDDARVEGTAAISSELNLATALLPVLARQLTPLAAIALALVIMGRMLARRRRRLDIPPVERRRNVAALRIAQKHRRPNHPQI